jgi:short-subunit dehydrogenase
MSRIAAVLGVGPGLGRALALKFAKEGMKVALMSRSLDKLEPVEKDIKEKYNGEAFSIPTDAGSEPSVKNAYDKIVEKWGAAPELFVFNAGSFTPGGILETSLEQFEKNLHINCTSAFIALKQVRSI